MTWTGVQPENLGMRNRRGNEEEKKAWEKTDIMGKIKTTVHRAEHQMKAVPARALSEKRGAKNWDLIHLQPESHLPLSL